jgi:hypothetical protein
VPDDIYFIGMKIWCCISDLPREIKKPSWLLIIIELGFEICNLGFAILRIRICDSGFENKDLWKETEY